MNLLLNRLHGVRPTGPGCWLARCPAHDDKRPSLSVREIEDGRVLLHCFAGCTVNEVVTAVGLGLEDLFPERALNHRRPRERRPFPATDVLRACAAEALIVCIIARALADGQPLGDEDRARLLTAASRFLAAVDAAGLDREGERLYRTMLRSRAAVLDLDAERARANERAREARSAVQDAAHG